MLGEGSASSLLTHPHSSRHPDLITGILHHGERCLRMVLTPANTANPAGWWPPTVFAFSMLQTVFSSLLPTLTNAESKAPSPFFVNILRQIPSCSHRERSLPVRQTLQGARQECSDEPTTGAPHGSGNHT